MSDNGLILPPDMMAGRKLVRKMPMSTFCLPEIGWYNPLPDITAMEVSQCMQMAIVGILPVPEGFMFDYKAYSEQNNLLRHFTATEHREKEANDNGQ